VLIPRKVTHEVKDQLYCQSQLNREAANLLAKFSKQHIGDCMAITLDGKIIFAAEIAAPLLDGLAISFDPDNQNSMLKAQQLRDQLGVKPLPLPVS
jgi:preprotein translocase subunit SecD